MLGASRAAVRRWAGRALGASIHFNMLSGANGEGWWLGWVDSSGECVSSGGWGVGGRMVWKGVESDLCCVWRCRGHSISHRSGVWLVLQLPAKAFPSSTHTGSTHTKRSLFYAFAKASVVRVPTALTLPPLRLRRPSWSAHISNKIDIIWRYFL